MLWRPSREGAGWVLWIAGGLLGLLFLRALGHRFSRVVGLIVLAGQLPGDVAGFVDELGADAPAALRSLAWADVWHFLSAALVFPRKMTVRGTDVTLRRLERIRLRYELEGWQHVRMKTTDGIEIDGALIMPPTDASRKRWIIFFNANMQKYEEWFFYFHRYAREAKVGMLVFNWRGVAGSGGYASCVDDLVKDGTAALQHLLDMGIDPKHILIHGLSIGACVAALVRARQPVAQHGPALLDRPFSTLSRVLGGYVEFGMGPTPGKQPCAKGCMRVLKRGLLELLAGLVWLILLATGWDGNTLRGFRNLQSTRIVTFHRNDNIIHFMRASLFQMLHRDQLAGRLPPPVDSAASPSVLARSPAVRWHVLELATPNDEWAPHDMPLFLDGEWFNALGLITGALRGEDEVAAAAAAAKSAGQKDGADGAQRHALAGERLRALSSLFGGKAPTRSSGASTHQASASPQLPPQRAAAAESDPGAGAYTRML